MKCLNPVLLNSRKLSEKYALKRYAWKLPFSFYVGCGKCSECEKAYSLQWAHRVMDELEYNQNKSCFLTLTYSDEFLPKDFNLVKKDYQNFLKRLRKRFKDVKIRYFGCGEYGGSGDNHRPHYHLILFGFCPDDLYFWQKDKKGYNLYRSPVIESLWLQGFSWVGIDFRLSIVKYLTKYLQKQNCFVEGRLPAFVCMSEGIGKGMITSECIETDKIYHDGKYIKVPRYYLDKLELYGFDLSELRKNRMIKCGIFESDIS